MGSMQNFWSGALDRLSEHFHGTAYDRKCEALQNLEEKLKQEGINPDRDERYLKLERETERLKPAEQKTSTPQGFSPKRS